MKGFFFAVTAILFFSILGATALLYHQRPGILQPWPAWMTLEKIGAPKWSIVSRVFR